MTIDSAPSIRMAKSEAISPFIDTAVKAYGEDGFTEEQTFVILSNALFTTEETRELGILHARKTSELI